MPLLKYRRPAAAETTLKWNEEGRGEMLYGRPWKYDDDDGYQHKGPTHPFAPVSLYRIASHASRFFLTDGFLLGTLWIIVSCPFLSTWEESWNGILKEKKLVQYANHARRGESPAQGMQCHAMPYVCNGEKVCTILFGARRPGRSAPIQSNPRMSPCTKKHPYISPKLRYHACKYTNVGPRAICSRILHVFLLQWGCSCLFRAVF